jgi:hypothetical protein
VPEARRLEPEVLVQARMLAVLEKRLMSRVKEAKTENSRGVRYSIHLEKITS